MEWMLPPDGIHTCAIIAISKSHEKETSMDEVSIIGIDLAKRVFQLHGATADGRVVFRKKLSRSNFLQFISEHPACVVAMEACATTHYWGREFSKMGHDVRLIPPIYVKPFVKRQKNDANDAEAIVEAASRPTMRFVAIKSAEQQALGAVFRSRDMLVRQRTQCINALRAHLAEYGIVSVGGVEKIRSLVNEASDVNLPADMCDVIDLYVQQIDACSKKISILEKKIKMQTLKDDFTRRLQSMPGVGPMTAAAIQAFAPPLEVFKTGRDFAAWLGLVPKQHSSGGNARLGRIFKMGQRDIRRLLVNGAMSVINAHHPEKGGMHAWLDCLLKRKSRFVAAIALANKMARALWAMTTRKEEYCDPVSAA
jgi:transposase